jgi:hypothetical protein
MLRKNINLLKMKLEKNYIRNLNKKVMKYENYFFRIVIGGKKIKGINE